MAAENDPSLHQHLGPEAFKKLYPDQYYRKFIERGIRPDGRLFGLARPTTIGLEAVSTADSSALIKIGSTTVLSGIKLEVLVTDKAVVKGELEVKVEATPLCGVSLDRRRSIETCTEQVKLLLRKAGALDLSKLTISSGRACWVIYLDMYILDADGSLLDACMLGAVAALSGLKTLPQVTVDDSGAVQSKEASQDGVNALCELIIWERLPVSLSCGFYGDTFSADLTAEEEQLMDCTITVTVDSSGRLIGLYKPGGELETSTSQLYDCIAHAKLRHKEILELLQQSLEEQ